MEDLKIFVTVVDSASFSAAANVLGTTVAAVSRRVKALEQRLGTRLLNRTTRRISLTEAGEVYFEQVRRTLADLQMAEERLAELALEPRGQLRLTAPMSFGVRRLAPAMAEFARGHPELRIQVQLDDRVIDIVEQGLDLALRIGYPRESSLVSRPIASVQRYICASPDYLEAHGTPLEPTDLLHHACLHYSNLSVREEWTLTGLDGPQPIEVQGGLCSNNGDVLCEAAVQGLGIVLLPDFIVEHALGVGRLRRVLEGYEPPPFILYGLYPSRQLVPRKVRLFMEFLSETLPHRSTVPAQAARGVP